MFDSHVSTYSYFMDKREGYEHTNHAMASWMNIHMPYGVSASWSRNKCFNHYSTSGESNLLSDTIYFWMSK